VLCVGRKFSNDPDVIEIDNSQRGRGVSGRLKTELEWRLGLQYLDFPGSHRIPEAVGRPWDVTHAHNLHGDYFDLAALERLCKLAPTILTLHDMWLLTGHCAHSFSCERWRLGCGSCPDLTIYPAIRRDSTRANLRRKHRLLQDLRLSVASPAAWPLELVAESYLADKPTRRMPNPVDTRVFRPGDKSEARTLLGLPFDRPIVLLPAWDAFASRFKGALMFEAGIRALADLRPLGLSFGDDASRSTEDIWIVPLSFDESRVACYYRAADVVVVPSDAETLPLAIIEAFATARPVVATRIGGIPELVTHGRNGLLVDAGDVRGFAGALRLILESPELAAELVAAGLEEARSQHDLDRVADLWLEWYLELAEHGVPTAPHIGA
jgi:glycosyltransferase involved in cell wall biosynthesis